MNRNEHLQWAKNRAFTQTNPAIMWAGFINDLGKHDDLKNHMAIELGNSLGMLIQPYHEVRKFIEGFN